jgi:asparagine synthetase B (glutamine-hydrolysing)
MCGIFFSLSASGPVLPNDTTVALLKNRGPDSFRTQIVRIEIPEGTGNTLGLKLPVVHLTFAATVLALRGDHIQPQPLVDPESRSVLCWNGEAWSIAGKPVCGNDAAVIFNCLLEAAQEKDGLLDGPLRKLITIFNGLTGPFSFVFYDGFNMKVYFGRDCLGRRSLLQSLDPAGNIRICSICDGSSSISFDEVETDGIYMIDLTRVVDYSQSSFDGPVAPFRIPWVSDDTVTNRNYSLVCHASPQNPGRSQWCSLPPIEKADTCDE